MTRRGVCKLADFGISKILGGTLSKVETTMGTPVYLSPEIVKSQPYNFATDIWSLGVLLYEMAALQVPWAGSNLVDIGVQICNGRFPPIPSQYSPAIKNLVSLCLQKIPSQRPSINSILNVPKIRNRIKHLLHENVYKEEFAHTVLHN